MNLPFSLIWSRSGNQFVSKLFLRGFKSWWTYGLNVPSHRDIFWICFAFYNNSQNVRGRLVPILLELTVLVQPRNLRNFRWILGACSLQSYVIAKFFQGGVSDQNENLVGKFFARLRRAKKGVPKFFACGGLFSSWRHWKPLKNRLKPLKTVKFS